MLVVNAFILALINFKHIYYYFKLYLPIHKIILK